MGIKRLFLILIASLFGLLAASASLLFLSSQASAQEGIKHKSAYNSTQGRDATQVTAQSGDLIEYTLRFDNTSTGAEDVAIEDDISDVLNLADMYNYNGAQLYGSILRFPIVTVSVGASVQKTFIVRVKYFSQTPSDMVMGNIYGDTVNVQVASQGGGGSTSQSLSAYNVTQGRDATSSSARAGDIIEYTLTYRNTSGSTQTVTIQDYIGDVLAYASVDSITNSGYLSGSTIYFPLISVNAGSQVIRAFRVRVNDLTTYSGDLIMSNTYGSQVNILVVPGSSPYVGSESGRSKSAYNQTQGVNAESVYARPGDIINYTLTFQNTTNASESVTIEDDLTDVLYLADIMNAGLGSLNGTILRFPALSAAAQSRVQVSFQVQVKNVFPNTADLMMSNFYGSGVDIKVSPNGTTPSGVVKGSYVSPNTGPDPGVAMGVALLSTLAWFVYSKYQNTKTKKPVSIK